MSLRERIDDGSVRYGVIGLGYVGLPLALAFAERGIRVLGFEVDPAKVDAIGAGTSYIPDVASEDLGAVVKAGTFEATTDFARIGEMDVISICVPTPLSKSQDPDVSYVDAATRELESRMRPEQLIVLESTTYPGMTEEFLAPRLEAGGLEAGEDFYLAFSPERVDPGNETWGVVNTPKVVGGVNAASTAIAGTFYRLAIDDVREVSSAAAAEMVKLLENTFRSVNIALVNEVALMCDRLGLDAAEIVQAADSKPFGFMRFDPGPGTGGHCIPLDPLYLSWKLRTLDYRARFVELSSDINRAMPQYLATRVAWALNEECKSVRGSRVLVLGVAYKRDVDDTRESPALEVIRHLLNAGADVVFADPYVESVTVGDRDIPRVETDAETLAGVDCLIVTTDHTAFPWERIARSAPLIVDARGAVPFEHVQGTVLKLSGPPMRGPSAPVPAESRA